MGDPERREVLAVNSSEVEARLRDTLHVSRLRVALIAASLLVYANALGGPFIFDDELSVLDNLNIRSLWPPWVAAWADHESPLSGRPIPAFSIALNYAAGGLSSFGYKFVNLGLHIACVLALFGVVRSALRLPAFADSAGERADAYAFAAALLFAVHPLASECVDYVTQRTESWMALFYLGALACSARARLVSGANGRAMVRWRVAAVGCCAAGMASKEVMVSAPLMILLFDRATTGRPLKELLREDRRYYIALASCWFIVAALMSRTFRTDTVGFNEEIGAIDYVFNQAWVIPRYLRLAVFPSGLAIDWGFPQPLAFSEVAFGFAFVAALAVSSVVLLVRGSALGFPMFFAFSVLSPTSTVIPILTEVGAERRMYLPLAALCVIAVVGIGGRVWLRGGSPRIAASGLLVVALALGSTTVSRNSVYQSSLGIWIQAAEVFPDNPRAHANLGREWDKFGDGERSLAAAERAIEADETYAPGHGMHGIALAKRGQNAEARRSLERAIELEPGYASPYFNLALLDLRAGDRETAVSRLESTLERNERHPQAALQLSWLLATQLPRDPDSSKRAIRLAKQGITLGSVSSESLDILAAAYASAGRFDQALRYGERARAHAMREGKPVAAIAQRLSKYRAGEAWSVARQPD
ncbi:MAG: hypothetical protein VX246_16485 [Myxococcota bacterium]|nr:hypothetical protein [Myxococcota bacterium]